MNSKKDESNKKPQNQTPALTFEQAMKKILQTPKEQVEAEIKKAKIKIPKNPN